MRNAWYIDIYPLFCEDFDRRHFDCIVVCSPALVEKKWGNCIFQFYPSFSEKRLRKFVLPSSFAKLTNKLSQSNSACDNCCIFSVQQDKKYRSANQHYSGKLYCETYWSHTETCSDVRGWSLFFRFSVSSISVVAATLESHGAFSVLLFYFCDSRVCDFHGPSFI